MRKEQETEILDALEGLYREVDEAARRLARIHGERLRCRSGCSSCCIDGLTVFEIEAGNIRRRHAGLLASGVPQGRGVCVFLDGQERCRIYEHRPYVCRTQGLPLRWVEERQGGELAELRDICPLNDEGEPVEYLAAKNCWTIGPFEGRLADLQKRYGCGRMMRPALRDLFGKKKRNRGRN
jgi:Fe-S-cluster containining protein